MVFKCPHEKAANPRKSSPSFSPSLWDESAPEMSLSASCSSFCLPNETGHANTVFVQVSVRTNDKGQAQIIECKIKEIYTAILINKHGWATFVLRLFAQ